MLATGFTTFLWSLIVIFFMVVYFLMLWPVVRLLSRLENRALAAR